MYIYGFNIINSAPTNRYFQQPEIFFGINPLRIYRIWLPYFNEIMLGATAQHTRSTFRRQTRWIAIFCPYAFSQLAQINLWATFGALPPPPRVVLVLAASDTAHLLYGRCAPDECPEILSDAPDAVSVDSAAATAQGNDAIHAWSRTQFSCTKLIAKDKHECMWIASGVLELLAAPAGGGHKVYSEC